MKYFLLTSDDYNFLRDNLSFSKIQGSDDLYELLHLTDKVKPIFNSHLFSRYMLERGWYMHNDTILVNLKVAKLRGMSDPRTDYILNAIDEYTVKEKLNQFIDNLI